MTFCSQNNVPRDVFVYPRVILLLLIVPIVTKTTHTAHQTQNSKNNGQRFKLFNTLFPKTTVPQQTPSSIVYPTHMTGTRTLEYLFGSTFQKKTCMQKVGKRPVRYTTYLKQSVSTDNNRDLIFSLLSMSKYSTCALIHFETYVMPN